MHHADKQAADMHFDEICGMLEGVVLEPTPAA
jgi:hypothetical protein